MQPAVRLRACCGRLLLLLGCSGAAPPLDLLLQSLPEHLPTVQQWLAAPERLPPRPDGEPTLAVGLMTQAEHIVVHGEDPVAIDFPAAAAAGANRPWRLAPGERLHLRPQGSGAVALCVEGGRAATALGWVYLRSVRGTPLAVDQVPYAAGYPWAGRQDRRYCGELAIVHQGPGGLTLVNHVGAETLLEGVVPAEMPAAAPLEALKAQAVAARSNLLARPAGRHPGHPYTLCAEQHCQVYAGAGRAEPRSQQAVRATRGEVLRAGGRPLEAAYSANCGGFSEDNDSVWGGAALPALRAQGDFAAAALPAWLRGGPAAGPMARYVRTPVPSYCQAAAGRDAGHFRWRRAFAAAPLAQRAKKRWPQLGELQDLQVVQRAAGGRVMQLALCGSRGRALLAPELPIRQFFAQLPSAAFVLERQAARPGQLAGWTFWGAGWGHGVGMCQAGAMGRARAGQAHREILAHYYRGASLIAAYGR